MAEHYARNAAFAAPSVATPAYVYIVDVPSALPPGISVVDPVYEVALHNSDPLVSPSYHHDGGKEFLLGVVDPVLYARNLRRRPASPPGMSAAMSPPKLTDELKTMVCALRDAEALVIGNIPSAWVIHRYDIF